MERETYTSEFSKDFLDKLSEISREIKEKFGVCVWFAEILGRRWSYIAGEKGEEDLFMPPERVQLSERLGAVIECGDIPEDKLDEIISFLRRKVEEL
jgi:hypothetical protein